MFSLVMQMVQDFNEKIFTCYNKAETLDIIAYIEAKIKLRFDIVL